MKSLIGLIAGFVLMHPHAQEEENRAFRIVEVPKPLAVGADYGLTVIKGARAQAERFAQFILSPVGQDILARHGFTPGEPR